MQVQCVSVDESFGNFLYQDDDILSSSIREKKKRVANEKKQLIETLETLLIRIFREYIL